MPANTHQEGDHFPMRIRGELTSSSHDGVNQVARRKHDARGPLKGCELCLLQDVLAAGLRRRNPGLPVDSLVVNPQEGDTTPTDLRTTALATASQPTGEQRPRNRERRRAASRRTEAILLKACAMIPQDEIQSLRAAAMQRRNAQDGHFENTQSGEDPVCFRERVHGERQYQLRRVTDDDSEVDSLVLARGRIKGSRRRQRKQPTTPIPTFVTCG